MSGVTFGNASQVGNTLQQVDLAIKTGQKLLHLEQAEQDRKQLEIERLRAEAVHAARPRSNTHASQEIMHLQGQLAEAGRLNAQRSLAIAERDKALAAKDAMILEWMHSNEAFKRLARQYGKIIGVSDEQRKDDFNEHIADVGEEDPKFSATKLGEKARGHLESRAKL